MGCDCVDEPQIRQQLVVLMLIFAGSVKLALFVGLCAAHALAVGKTCTLKPSGHNKSDVSQVGTQPVSYRNRRGRCQLTVLAQIEAAISECGHGGTTVFLPGVYNITRYALKTRAKTDE